MSTDEAESVPPAQAEEEVEQVEDSQEVPNVESAKDEPEAPILMVRVEGDSTRTPASDFAMNKGLKEALASDGTIKFKRCANREAHNILECSDLHDLDVVVKLDTWTWIRLKSLWPNAAMNALLADPLGCHRVCKSKKKHNVEACTGLHLRQDIFPIGKERVPYLADEVIHTAAYRHLLSNPKHHGRWCTNVLKHDPYSCPFLHRVPRRGETLGKTHTNADPVTGFANTAFKFICDVPGVGKTRKTRALDKHADVKAMVDRINADDDDEEIGDAPHEGEDVAAAPRSAVPPAAPTMDSHRKVSESHAPEKKIQLTSKHGDVSITASAQRPEVFGYHPAVVGVVLAIILSLLVQLLPSS